MRFSSAGAADYEKDCLVVLLIVETGLEMICVHLPFSPGPPSLPRLVFRSAANPLCYF